MRRSSLKTLRDGTFELSVREGEWRDYMMRDMTYQYSSVAYSDLFIVAPSTPNQTTHTPQLSQLASLRQLRQPIRLHHSQQRPCLRPGHRLFPLRIQLLSLLHLHQHILPHFLLHSPQLVRLRATLNYKAVLLNWKISLSKWKMLGVPSESEGLKLKFIHT